MLLELNSFQKKNQLGEEFLAATWLWTKMSKNGPGSIGLIGAIRHSSIFFFQRFDYRGMLGECGDFPFGYIGEQVTLFVKSLFSDVYLSMQWCR